MAQDVAKRVLFSWFWFLFSLFFVFLLFFVSRFDDDGDDDVW